MNMPSHDLPMVFDSMSTSVVWNKRCRLVVVVFALVVCVVTVMVVVWLGVLVSFLLVFGCWLHLTGKPNAVLFHVADWSSFVSASLSTRPTFESWSIGVWDERRSVHKLFNVDKVSAMDSSCPFVSL